MSADDNIVPPRTITNGHHTTARYQPTWTDTRPGSQDHELIPSRMCDMLHYRNGHKEKIDD
jgi:hypothetical protein